MENSFSSQNQQGVIIKSYHRGGDVFLEYFKSILLELKETAVIVIDNAPYHSRKCVQLPTTSWNKKQLVEWSAMKGMITVTTLQRKLLQVVKEGIAKHDKYVSNDKVNKTVLSSHHITLLHRIDLSTSIWLQSLKHNLFQLKHLKPLLEGCLENVCRSHNQRRKCGSSMTL